MGGSRSFSLHPSPSPPLSFPRILACSLLAVIASGIVKTLAYLFGSTVGGAIGWWIGAKFGTMSAYMLSTILGGVGMYYAHKWSKEHLG